MLCNRFVLLFFPLWFPLCLSALVRAGALVLVCVLLCLPLSFSAVQMNNGSKSVRTVRRMCHGLPLRVGFSCVVILTTCLVSVLAVSPRCAPASERLRQMAPVPATTHNPALTLRHALPCPCVTIVACPALAYRVRLRVRVSRVPARVCLRACARARHPRACPSVRAYARLCVACLRGRARARGRTAPLAYATQI